MNGLFDALITPKRYFKKTPETYLGSFFSLMLIIVLNELSLRSFIFKMLSFYNLTGILFLVLIPLLVYFIIIGIDLMFIRGDKNHWIKTHLSATYAPYLFLPLIMPIITRNGWLYKVFGLFFILILCLWSFYLYKLIIRNKFLPFLRLIKDFALIIFLVFSH